MLSFFLFCFLIRRTTHLLFLQFFLIAKSGRFHFPRFKLMDVSFLLNRGTASRRAVIMGHVLPFCCNPFFLFAWLARNAAVGPPLSELKRADFLQCISFYCRQNVELHMLFFFFPKKVLVLERVKGHKWHFCWLRASEHAVIDPALTENTSHWFRFSGLHSKHKCPSRGLSLATSSICWLALFMISRHGSL